MIRTQLTCDKVWLRVFSASLSSGSSPPAASPHFPALFAWHVSMAAPYGNDWEPVIGSDGTHVCQQLLLLRLFRAAGVSVSRWLPRWVAHLFVRPASPLTVATTSCCCSYRLLCNSRGSYNHIFHTFSSTKTPQKLSVNVMSGGSAGWHYYILIKHITKVT